MDELVGEAISVAVEVRLGVGVAVKNPGVKLKVEEGYAGVKLTIGVNDAVAVGFVGGGLIMIATNPRQ